MYEKLGNKGFDILLYTQNQQGGLFGGLFSKLGYSIGTGIADKIINEEFKIQ